jgi:parallel beta-helix repeat protein
VADYIYYVNPAATTGGDGTADSLTGGTCAFQTLNSAITSIAGNETGSGAGNSGDNVTIRCSGNTGNWVDSTAVLVSGFTTGINLIIEGYNGSYTGRQLGDNYDATNCYAVENSASFAQAYDMRWSGAITRYLQINQKNSTNNNHTVTNGGAPRQETYDSCRVRHTKSNASKYGVAFYLDSVVTGTTTIKNCTIEGNGNASTTGIHNKDADGLEVYNNTIYDCGIGVLLATSSNIVIQNTAIAGCTDDWSGSVSGGTQSYNADSNDGDTPGTNNQTLSTTLTDEFTSPSTGDFTVASDGASNNIWDNGTSGGSIPTVDINGTSRSNYSIGAWEYVSAGGVTPIPPPLQKTDNQFATIIAHRLGGVLQ